MGQEVLVYISLIVGVAAILAIIGRIIKQPPIISYLIAGIVVGPLFFGLIGPDTATTEFIRVFAHIGVALLLFIVGLSLDLKILKDVGGVSSLAGLGQIIVTATIGFLIAIGFGFNQISAIYLAVAIAFSSTVVVIKILSDKREMNTLHARIALGILIVQDFVAALALMIVPAIQNGNVSSIFFTVVQILALILFIFAFSIFILKRFIHHLAKNQEVLFLFGIAWALLLATLFNYLGFSLEIGALIAGMSLASTKYSLELGGKIKPLRDFFVVLFFVFFGSQLAGSINSTLITQAVILSLFVLIGKPLIIMAFMKSFGYKKRTNFLTGSSLAQISEFSLILILLGFTLGHVSQEMMNLVVLVSLITIAISSYGLYHSQIMFNKLSGLLNIFEGKRDDLVEKKERPYEIILIGYNRMGYSLLGALKKMRAKFVIIDYDPKVIMSLSKKDIPCIYGDASDTEFLEELRLDEVKLVISTISEEEPNLFIKERINASGSKAIFIATSENPAEALDLYNAGADYVIIPRILGGEYASKLLQKSRGNYRKFKTAAKEHIKELKKRLKDD